MPENKSENKRINTIIGSVLIFGILAIIISTSLGNFTDIFKTQNYDVCAYYTNIGDLKVGAPVSLGGIQVGEVTAIEMLDDMQIKAAAALKLQRSLPIDSVLSIESTTVSGDTYIAIIRGTSTQTLKPDSACYKLKGNSFFNISNLSSFAQSLEKSFADIQDNLKALIGKDSKLNRELKTFRQEKDQLLSEYNKLKKLISERQKSYNQLDQNINACIKKAELIKAKIAKGLPPQINKNITANLEQINKSKDLLLQVRDENEENITRIKDNASQISAWFSAFTIPKNSVVSVLSSGSCSGLPATISLINTSMTRVMDFSLMKKLGFYFKAKDLYSCFLESVPQTYHYSPSALYSSWVKFEYNRKQRILRTTPDGCQIK